MKILIGCEESQTVCKALRELGHEAYSNDLIDCSGGYPEWHLKMCIMEAIDLMEWDMIGMHPVCTKMALSGNRHYAPGKERHQERIDSVEWTVSLWNKAISRCSKVYMENPLGAMNRDHRLPKPQIIQPYFFGDKNKKSTCLWMHGLPFLYHAKCNSLFGSKTHVEPNLKAYKSKKNKTGISYYDAELGRISTSGNNNINRAIRSKTFPGIAKAIAEQWAGKNLI